MKLFFAFDLDGTLLRYDNTIHPENVQVLKKLKELGHILAIATGRGLAACLDVWKKYPYFDYLVSNNGTLIHDVKTKQTTNNGSLSKEVVANLLEDCKQTESICAISTPDELYEFSTKSDHDWLQNQQIMDLMFYQKVNEKQLKNIIEKETITQLAFRNDQKIIAELSKKWSKILQNSYKVTITNQIFLDINPLEVDKAFAIESLLAKNNLSQSKLVAFGDSSNDFLMIKLARYGFAMEHATPDLLTVAACKIGECDSGTIAKTIEILLDDQEKLFS
ncbi:Cof-type HAD-IIB family hydrolase [Mycoplasma sp. 'Moose RK']|uniref:Cof-type HAD-IIB family hydrolase n=1 Tax=Mycoplasma sp. 'Moose RK' TaxID=2780095 RepID=UPI0018C22268|nr:Cof-type HAD-IIB family hydrolase [Mycoplasma sp. 'Moose RK']MBG0730656.1 Cof-type HAD-IIB family hydrolase [Mycoplasma sp. 'Moose RK']